MSAYSDAVYAAQAALLARRQSLQKPTVSVNKAVANDTVDVSITAVFSHLPPHLGWHNTAVSHHLHKNSQPVCTGGATGPDSGETKQLNRLSRPSSKFGQCKEGRDSAEVSCFVEAEVSPRCPATTKTPDQVRHYPDLGIAAMDAQRVPHYQVWLACKVIDENGRGWLPTRTVTQQLAEQGSPLRLFGRRRLRQVLQGGNGRFWTWDKQHHRLWLFSAARIAKQLKIGKLTSQPVLLPIKALTSGISTFKAHLYAAWHSGRKTSNPISRQTQRKLLKVPERTQRHYEKIAGVQVKTNLAIGNRYTPENIEAHTWQRGGAVFQFHDKQGRLGKRNGRYIAFQLPNQYVGPHQQAARGKLVRINRQLNDLVHEGAQGNSDTRLQQRYFAHGAAAAKAIQREQCDEVYWPLRQHQRSQLWSLFSNVARSGDRP